MNTLTKKRSKPTIEDIWQGCMRLSIKSMYSLFMQQPKSFWCACAYLILEYVRPQTIYPWIDILPWPLLAVGLCLLFSIQEGQKNHPSGGIAGGLIALSLVVLLSSIAGTSPSTSFQHWRSFYDWIIIYFIIRRAVNDERKLFLFMVLFFLANFKMTQHGFLSWAMRGFAFESWGVTGGPGWFHNSGEFGIQLSIFVPMLLGVTIAMKSQWSRTTQAVVFIILITGIGSAIATSSRGALVGLAAAFIWMAMRSKYFVRAAILVSLVGIITYSLIPEESMARFKSSGSDTTSLHRLERWQNAWQAMKDNPVLGVGFKNWEVYYPIKFVPEIPGPMMVHNMFFEAGSELGFTGLFLFLMLISLCLLATKRVRQLCNLQADKFILGLSYGLDGALIGMIVSCSFVTVFYYPYFWIHCLFVSSLFAAAHEKQSATKNKKSTKNQHKNTGRRFLYKKSTPI